MRIAELSRGGLLSAITNYVSVHRLAAETVILSTAKLSRGHGQIFAAEVLISADPDVFSRSSSA
jgi:hypothetical protein